VIGARALPTPILMAALNGSPSYQETISASTTSAKNSTALAGGSVVLLQSDADFYLVPGTSSTTATEAAGVLVAADEKFFFILGSTQTHVAVITASGTASVKVFTLS
jgi:enterochelin esterase-like enzyme